MKTYRDFFEDIRNKNLKKILIFQGTDHYLMKRSWEGLSERIGGEHHFYILDDLRTSERREKFLKTFSESDIFSKKRKIFIVYLDRIPPYFRNFLMNVEKIDLDNFLILVVGEDKNISFVDSYGLKEIQVYHFPEVSEEEGLRWISREFRKRGKIVSPKVARFIYEVSAGKLGIMKNLIEIISFGFVEKSIPSPSSLKEILRKTYSFNEFINVLKPGENVMFLLGHLHRADFSEYEINSILNNIAKRLYNNRKYFIEEKAVYDVIYYLCGLQKEMQTKNMNKKIYFLNKISEILLKKEVDFGISGAY